MILIVGCGFYGCHAALVLMRLGYEIRMVDILDDFFAGSSSKSQNRLHQGFHYPHNLETRLECKQGFDLFLKQYPHMATPVQNNWYVVDNNSSISFQDYKSLFSDYTIVSSLDFPFTFKDTMVQGVVSTDEYVIDFEMCRNYFKNKLEKYMVPFNNVMYDEYDTIIDCTYGSLNHIHSAFYEVCLSVVLEYRGDADFALTIMDGPFFSIYPYKQKEKLYTLTDVEYTPVLSCASYPNIDIDETTINDTVQKMISKVKTYIPDFDDHFQYNGYFLSTKTKFPSDTADRSLRFEITGNRYTFVGGKIGGIFEMERILTKHFTR